MKKIYGIIGHPVTRSLSPAIHNAGIEHYGIKAEYKLFDIDPKETDGLANFCYETEVNNIGGFSVTTPYKQAMMAYMDEYDPLVKIIATVNTVINDNGRLLGYNTDAMGAMQALREKVEISRKKALVMGMGGAARAIAYSLKQYNADVYIFNRTLKRAEVFADEFDLETIEYRMIQKANFDIIINATPVGSLPNTKESLLHTEHIPSKAVVMDIVTNPIGTQLLKEAKKAGAKIVSGERMLLHQAVNQFKLFFDKEAPFKVMEKAMYEEIERMR